jgi:hypothetical protein
MDYAERDDLVSVPHRRSRPAIDETGLGIFPPAIYLAIQFVLEEGNQLRDN